jgi:subtilisin family serine protease
MGLIRPDVCAPGVIIWSLKYNSIYDYDFMSGTSQATPCVAGIVALMLHDNPELTPSQICQILEETSLRLTPTKSNRTGVGRVDALAAVSAVSTWNVKDESFDIVPDIHDASIQRVFDLTGRIVTTDKLSSGIYLIQYLQGNQLKAKKIVVP